MKKLFLLFLMSFLCMQISLSQTWVQKLNGIAMWSMAKDLQGNVYAGSSGTVKSIYKSTDGGNNWITILSGGVSNFLSIAVDSANNIYAANVSNGLMKSTDGGNNWITIPSSTFNGKSTESVACGRNGYIYVGVISGGIFRSTDYGATFPDTAISTGTFVTMFVDRYNSSIIFGGASSTSGITGLYRSTDRGVNYTFTGNINNSWGIIQKTTSLLFMITTSTGSAFTKSTDAGITWTTAGTQPGSMRGVTLDMAGNIYICGNGGVFKSTNDGASFNNMNITISGNQIICFQNKIMAAMIGTSNGGVWIYTDTTISRVSNKNIITENYKLYQNFPNPFNPATTIIYNLPENSFVKLAVYDILGREIDILVNEKQISGKYEVKFYNNHIPSGIYFYKIETDCYSDVKKMMFIK